MKKAFFATLVLTFDLLYRFPNVLAMIGNAPNIESQKKLFNRRLRNGVFQPIIL